jgi:hypothetical protein
MLKPAKKASLSMAGSQLRAVMVSCDATTCVAALILAFCALAVA